MDYFSVFTQMLQAKGLTDNTIRSYKTYIKPYLAYLSAISVTPEDASWQQVRTFISALEAPKARLAFRFSIPPVCGWMNCAISNVRTLFLLKRSMWRILKTGRIVLFPCPICYGR